jgi:hypothetical protein
MKLISLISFIMVLNHGYDDDEFITPHGCLAAVKGIHKACRRRKLIGVEGRKRSATSGRGASHT